MAGDAFVDSEELARPDDPEAAVAGPTGPEDLEAPEADAAEQSIPVVDELAGTRRLAAPGGGLLGEVSEGDAAEQSVEVPLEDEDYR